MNGDISPTQVANRTRKDLSIPEPKFVNLLKSLGIDSQSGGPVPARQAKVGGIDSLESIPGLLKRLQIQVQISFLGPRPIRHVAKSQNQLRTHNYIRETLMTLSVVD